MAKTTTTATEAIAPLSMRPAWRALQGHHERVGEVHLRDLFARDRTRGERLTADGAGLFLDYSKNRITAETLALLVALAEESGLKEHTEAMFRGDRINVSENRSVLHVALRMPKDESLIVDGNVRSGQTIMHPQGDVTIIGRVASGAEIVAGGSVHIYGALQGRVIAGISGSRSARIFCTEARAELLCIGGAYVTAENTNSEMEGRALEARLDGDELKLRILS